jgi:uncharacterized protein (DUF1697 family)
MPQHVAFLRAINVAGRYIKMAALAQRFQAIGFADARTFINSGNVIFSSNAKDLTALAARLESQLEPLLGFKSEVFVRSAEGIHAMALHGREHMQRVGEGGEVNVAFLAAALSAEQVAATLAFKTDIDDFEFEALEIYWLCQGRQTDSKFSNVTLERKLRIRTTFRRVSMLENLSQQLRL